MNQNPTKQHAMVSGRDRISELPNDIIREILSNLPTKDAVATTILSKRWKDQWTYCFNLDFSDSEFLRFDPYFSSDEYDEAREIRFVDVKDVIALNKSPCIKKFRLESFTIYESDVTACLDSIASRNVEEVELNVSVYQKSPLILPQSLFTCPTLVSLKMGSNAICDIDLPPSLHLPSLKVFHAKLDYPSNAVTTKLFCDLPVLEDLSFSMDSIYDRRTLNIFTPSLKRLKLKLEATYGYQIVVRVPSLKEFDVCDDYIANYVFEELPLDVKARLEFGRCYSLFDDEAAAHAIQLINGIVVVKSLALPSCIPGTQDFGNVVFPNATCLEVDVSTCCRFAYLPCLIYRFPNLVFLVLKLVSADLGHVPHCLLLHLKRIEVRLFCGQEYELKLLESLLKFAQVLDDVVICTHNMMLEERKNLHMKLSLFCHGTKNCQFTILE